MNSPPKAAAITGWRRVDGQGRQTARQRSPGARRDLLFLEVWREWKKIGTIGKVDDVLSKQIRSDLKELQMAD